jgi:polysaccharide pyruvyl transferase WcaK-like protein
MSQVPKVFVDHGEAYGNLGDEAMLLRALSRLRQYLGPCKVLLTAAEAAPLPDGLVEVERIRSPRGMLRHRATWVEHQFEKLYRLPSVWRWLAKPSDFFFWRAAVWLTGVEGWLWRWKLWHKDSAFSQWRKTIRGCDLFYGVGAATLNEPNQYGLVYKAWLYGEVERAIPCRVLSAQGLGPFQTKSGLRAVKRCLRAMSAVSFRDCAYSLSVARRLRLRHVEQAITGDEAFTLPVAADQDVESFLRAAGIEPGEPFVAVHFRATDYTRETESLLPHIVSVLDGVMDQLPRLLFIPMSYDTHSGKDEEYGERIRAALRLPSHWLVAPLCKDVQLIKGVVGRAYFSLGLSYHLHVFSLSQGHPAVILYTGDYYRLKSDGLIGFYGHPSVALDLDKVDTIAVREAIRQVEIGYGPACQAIQSVNEAILKENDWVLRQLVLRLGRRMGDVAQ